MSGSSQSVKDRNHLPRKLLLISTIVTIAVGVSAIMVNVLDIWNFIGNDEKNGKDTSLVIDSEVVDTSVVDTDPAENTHQVRLLTAPRVRGGEVLVDGKFIKLIPEGAVHVDVSVKPGERLIVMRKGNDSCWTREEIGSDTSLNLCF
jgi:hypothetical protein